VLVWLAVGSGALCLAIGGTYIATRATSDMPVALIATLSLLGGLALPGAALWQGQALADRRLPLLALALLATGFAAANGLGLSIAQLDDIAPGRANDLQAVLHATGIGAGAVLFLATTAELVGQEAEPPSTTATAEQPPADSGLSRRA
jgi:hypothetical protein